MAERSYIKDVKKTELHLMSPREFRRLVREGKWTDVTAEVCWGYGQANLIVVPKEYALEFVGLCLLNPQPFPLLEITEPGNPFTKRVAQDADLRTDLPKYRVFVDGRIVAEPTDARDYWRDDLVGFVIGCSWGFVWALRDAGVPYRSLGDYTTEIELRPFGRLRGRVVCSCRAFPTVQDAISAVRISAEMPAFHGQPIHVGDPARIGIRELGKPDAFVPPWPTTPPADGEIVMFWACGITAQNVVIESRIPFAISHYPGHMFVMDWSVYELKPWL